MSHSKMVVVNILYRLIAYSVVYLCPNNEFYLLIQSFFFFLFAKNNVRPIFNYIKPVQNTHITVNQNPGSQIIRIDMPAVQLAPRTSKLEFYIGGTKINYKQLNNSNLD